MRRTLGGVPFIAASLLPAQTLIWPGEPIATIDADQLRAYVPAAAADSLRPLVARADQIYSRMQADAGFVPGERLRVLCFDWEDDHNGYSFVVPFPLVQVQLAPARGPSTIFAGGFDAERTLIHEFAHQLSNDRNQGVRRQLESVFGRVLPNDLFSLVLWYLSTPAHQTMPRFWQEGIAIWAETAYAEPGSVFGGRGRDALTHMVWRLDAAAGAIPTADAWRITYHEWPFGNRAYVYGAAYTRWLAGRFGDRSSLWDFVTAQAQQWPFRFDRGLRARTGQRHGDLLEAARRDLQREQEGQLATLRRRPVTALTRRTPVDLLAGAPAWLPDGSVTFAAKPAQGRARRHVLRPDGELVATGEPTWALGSMRTLPDAAPADDDGERALVYDEFTWRRRSRLVLAGDELGIRLYQPDAGPALAGVRTVVAVRLRDGGGQELVAFSHRDGELDGGAVLPTQGIPWTPALRPGRGAGGNPADELVWVETTRDGSSLVLGRRSDPAWRHVLWAVRGRLLHPVWSTDGNSLYCCADPTGVANAYRLDLGGDAAAPTAVVTAITNTLGGVLACVPSPDGTQLALLDHDHRGPFVATLPNDPATYVRELPTLPLAWPAPRDGDPAATAAATATLPAPLPPLPAGAAAALAVEPYRGLGEVRPRFWAPTTLAVPSGGYGVYGLASDPLFTNVVQAGVGVGLVEAEPVGFLGYDNLASVVEFGASLGRRELTFADTVVRGDREFDYSETVAHGEVRAGRGLFAIERTLLAYTTAGVADHDEVDASRRAYGGTGYVKAPFRDTEHFVEVTLGYADSILYPTSYAAEDGVQAVAVFRHSGLGGDLERNRALADVGYTWSVLPEAGHQLVVRGQLGWSDGDDTLQGNFSVGGGLGTGLPRGYLDEAVVTGRYLVGGSLAWRFPLWRPFVAASTTPFRGRQLVLELFGDTARIDDQRLGGGTRDDWFTSVGGELHLDAEFFDNLLSPGLGVACQLDGERDVRVYLALGFSF